jgi:hypothetical protein
VFIGIFGKRIIRLNRGQGSVFSGIGKIGRTWKFTYDRNCTINIWNSGGNVERYVFIEKFKPAATLSENSDFDLGALFRAIKEASKNQFTFGRGLSSEAQEYITAFLIREARQCS